MKEDIFMLVGKKDEVWMLSSLVHYDGISMAVIADELCNNPFPITNEIPIDDTW